MSFVQWEKKKKNGTRRLEEDTPIKSSPIEGKHSSCTFLEKCFSPSTNCTSTRHCRAVRVDFQWAGASFFILTLSAVVNLADIRWNMQLGSWEMKRYEKSSVSRPRSGAQSWLVQGCWLSDTNSIQFFLLFLNCTRKKSRNGSYEAEQRYKKQ